MQGAPSNILSFWKNFKGFPLQLSVSNILEEAPKLLVKLMSISAQAGRFLPYNVIGVFLFCSRVVEVIRPLLSGSVLVGFLSLVSLFKKGFIILFGTTSQL